MKAGDLYWFLFACLLFCDRGIAQDVQVLVLDALDGKPQAHVKVEPFCIGTPRNFQAETAFTNNNGIATISFVCNDKQVIQIEVFPPNKKEQCGPDAMTSLNDVTSLGFISNPISGGAGGMSCPTRISKKLKPVPGEVIIFVKKPTWWQSHVAG